jgi:hypothetical protein
MDNIKVDRWPICGVGTNRVQMLLWLHMVVVNICGGQTYFFSLGEYNLLHLGHLRQIRQSWLFCCPVNYRAPANIFMISFDRPQQQLS